MNTDTIAGIASGILTILAFVPIIRSVRANNLRPHRTSWFIWSAAYIVMLAQQLSSGFEPIAFRTATSAAIAIYLFVYAVRHQVYAFSRKTLYPMVFIVMICLYANFYATSLQAALLMCVVTLAAILPMARRLYYDPWSESLTLILANGIASVFALLSLGSHPSLPKQAFPIFILFATHALLIVVVVKRQYHKQKLSADTIREKSAQILEQYSSPQA